MSPTASKPASNAGLTTGSGRDVQPSAALAKGGQGEVFSLADTSGTVFKRIFDSALQSDPDLPARLGAMVRNPPDGWREAKGHVMLAWPTDIVLEGGRFVGFLMPRINTTSSVELHQIANPSDRQQADPHTPWTQGFTWQYLVSTATNLALAVKNLHAAQVVIGDFNERNILVGQDARVTLLDCDSMQISDRSADKKYLCRVGRPEFTAPELLTADWNKTVRAASSDLFALAIHLHQLLLEGAHPFDGVWHAHGDKPKRPELARDGLWVYGDDSRLSPRPSAVALATLPTPVAELFRRAFIDGATNPRRRPTAEEWHTELQDLRQHLAQCPKDPQHWHARSLTECPWCRRSRSTTQTPLPHAQAPASSSQPITVSRNSVKNMTWDTFVPSFGRPGPGKYSADGGYWGFYKVNACPACDVKCDQKCHCGDCRGCDGCHCDGCWLSRSSGGFARVVRLLMKSSTAAGALYVESSDQVRTAAIRDIDWDAIVPSFGRPGPGHYTANGEYRSYYYNDVCPSCDVECDEECYCGDCRGCTCNCYPCR